MTSVAIPIALILSCWNNVWMLKETEIEEKYSKLARFLDERARRVWAATEAAAVGRGGISLVARATGLSRNTIVAGQRDLSQRGRPADVERERLRHEGGGRKRLVESDSSLLMSLEKLVEPHERGDPVSPLRWTSKSTRRLADELRRQGYEVSYRSVGRLLGVLGYSLQANFKTKEGASDPDRNAQFEYINQQVSRFQKRGSPTISVDAKAKEKIGEFKSGGAEYRPKGEPEQVDAHDFEHPELGKGLPYGVYDFTHNNGWVSVGTDHDTAEFAVATIRRWWKKMGEPTYPDATELLITADSGGSNSPKLRLWKAELQDFADETGLDVTVCHLPPGTSKWNKIEHRMFSFITQNWRGRPLISLGVMVNLIANTTTKSGLKIRAVLDNGNYETGMTVTKERYDSINLTRASFRGDWNYTISPKK
jgi:hypothetical protein